MVRVWLSPSIMALREEDEAGYQRKFQKSISMKDSSFLKAS
jgi:hypothetical protein